MSEALAVTPPVDGTREDLIRFYQALLATPHSSPDAAALRREGIAGLTLLGAAPSCRRLARRRVALVSTHFRAPRPRGRIKRL